MIFKQIIVGVVAMMTMPAVAQTTSATEAEDSIDALLREMELKEVQIVKKKQGQIKSHGIMNETKITTNELTKAACCNLGESFTTNPSVDVSYSDAATGAKQIKLLGLSGSYVQMLTENMPNFRGAASPYALGYVPGPWMQSIQVSKGSSSVKNGYESITGQINIEYLKPQFVESVNANLYGDINGRFEANADANYHFNSKLSTGLLLHYENNWGNHDDNGDGFLDTPKVRQYNVQNRWGYFSDRYIFQGGVKVLDETRESGQTTHSHNGESVAMDGELFGINLKTQRYEAFAKNAFFLDEDQNSNIALMMSGSFHSLDAGYGNKFYGVDQKNFYASLMYENYWGEMHSLSAGLSLNHDYYNQRYRLTHDLSQALTSGREKETTPGAYAQYTFNYDDKIMAMAGVRIDHSSVYGTFVTPRMHVKYMPVEWFSVRASAGKGYRTVHAMAEYNNLIASGRAFVADDLQQEAAWNYGISSSAEFKLFGRDMNINAEYYYTNFDRQAIVDYETNPSEIRITNLQGRSYSHVVQVDATYEVVRGLSFTAAYRLNKVKATYNGQLMEKALTNRYKGLFSLSYKTPMDIWQFDVTLQLNGGGRMPTPYTLSDSTSSWSPRYHAYEQLSAQITRWFRHFSIYVGGENLTGFKQKNPIVNASSPWSTSFDPTMVWGPVHGAMVYAGVRLKFEKF
jgi:outer membrane receptor for ferrienterochelin and colicin